MNKWHTFIKWRIVFYAADSSPICDYIIAAENREQALTIALMREHMRGNAYPGLIASALTHQI